MTAVVHIAESQALGLCALEDSDPDKQQALAHTRECASCQALWNECVNMLGLLDEELALTPLEVPPLLAAKVQAAVLSGRAAEAPARSAIDSLWLLCGTLLSAVLVWLDATPSLELAPLIGLRCTRYEVAFAGIALVASFGWARFAKRAITPLRAASISMTGALAGQALLHTRCEAPHAALHLLVFHLLGVVLATALCAGVIRTRSRVP